MSAHISSRSSRQSHENFRAKQQIVSQKDKETSETLPILESVSGGTL
jgi:hypothetical protein